MSRPVKVQNCGHTVQQITDMIRCPSCGQSVESVDRMVDLAREIRAHVDTNLQNADDSLFFDDRKQFHEEIDRFITDSSHRGSVRIDIHDGGVNEPSEIRPLMVVVLVAVCFMAVFPAIDWIGAAIGENNAHCSPSDY